MVGAARGCAAGSDQVGAANVGSGHIKWSKTVDPSAVQGIPGVVSENSRPLFVVPRQTDVLSFAAAGCTEGETALQLGIAVAMVRGHLARVRARLGARGTCQAIALAVSVGLVVVLQRVATDFEV